MKQDDLDEEVLYLLRNRGGLGPEEIKAALHRKSGVYDSLRRLQHLGEIYKTSHRPARYAVHPSKTIIQKGSNVTTTSSASSSKSSLTGKLKAAVGAMNASGDPLLAPSSADWTLRAAIEQVLEREGASTAPFIRTAINMPDAGTPGMAALVAALKGLREDGRVDAVGRQSEGGIILYGIVSKGAMTMLGHSMEATCGEAGCTWTVKAGPTTRKRLREAFDHDQEHGIVLRTIQGGVSVSLSRRELEEADARAALTEEESDEAAPTAEPQVTTNILPDGRPYAARNLGTIADVEVLRRCRSHHISVLLEGPPGTGKTAMVLGAFDDVITINGDGDTTVADLVGTWTASGMTNPPYVWSDGPLTRAMREGRPLFIDDCTLISPKVLAVVYPVMDGRGAIWIKEHPIRDEADDSWAPDYVVAAEGFWIVGGHNPGVHGAVLSDALSSRFALHVEVPTDFDMARLMGLDASAVKLAQNMAGRAEAGHCSWFPQLRELMAFDLIKKVLSKEHAVAGLINLAPPEDRGQMAEEVKSVFGQVITALSVGGLFTDSSSGKSAS